MRSAFALSAILIASASCAQDAKFTPAPRKKTTAETKRGAYVVKYANAKDVADALSRHFKGDAEIHAGPENSSDCLLINAPPAVFDEIVNAVDQLDRRPRTIAVDVYFVELQAKTEGDDPSSKNDLGVPVTEVEQRLNAMTRSGKAASVKRIQLGATEGQLASVLIGENKPYVMGAAMTGRGAVSKQITYRNIGTQVRVTPHVMADGTISLELNIEDTSGRPSATASVGSDEKGAAIPAADFTNTSFKGKLVVASGQAVLANAAKSNSKSGQAETMIVVGARVVETAAKKK